MPLVGNYYLIIALFQIEFKQPDDFRVVFYYQDFPGHALKI
jgi:hypothetical protein